MNKKKQDTEITCNEFASRYNKKIKHVFFPSTQYERHDRVNLFNFEPEKLTSGSQLPKVTKHQFFLSQYIRPSVHTSKQGTAPAHS